MTIHTTRHTQAMFFISPFASCSQNVRHSIALSDGRLAYPHGTNGNKV
jgi:hypothetical protein